MLLQLQVMVYGALLLLLPVMLPFRYQLLQQQPQTLSSTGGQVQNKSQRQVVFEMMQEMLASWLGQALMLSGQALMNLTTSLGPAQANWL